MVSGLRGVEYGREEGDGKDDDARGALGGECLMQKGDIDYSAGNSHVNYDQIITKQSSILPSTNLQPTSQNILFPNVLVHPHNTSSVSFFYLHPSA